MSGRRGTQIYCRGFNHQLFFRTYCTIFLSTMPANLPSVGTVCRKKVAYRTTQQPCYGFSFCRACSQATFHFLPENAFVESIFVYVLEDVQHFIAEFRLTNPGTRRFIIVFVMANFTVWHVFAKGYGPCMPGHRRCHWTVETGSLISVAWLASLETYHKVLPKIGKGQ